MIETHKLSLNQGISDLNYADKWLSTKFFEYNSLLEEIRDDYKEMFKRMQKADRDQNEQKDEYEENLSSAVYKIFYGRNQEGDNVLESNEWAQVNYQQQDDESSI